MTTLDDNNYTDYKSVSVMPEAQKYGLIGGAALIVLGLVLYLAGMTDYSGNKSNTVSSILQYVVMGGTLFFAMKEHRTRLGGYMPYGRALGVGSLTGLFMAILLGIWSYIFFSFIAPDLIDQMVSTAEEQMAEKGLGEDEMETALAYTQKIMTPAGMAIMTTFGTAVGMFFLSLIVSAFTKKDAPIA